MADQCPTYGRQVFYLRINPHHSCGAWYNIKGESAMAQSRMKYKKWKMILGLRCGFH